METRLKSPLKIDFKRFYKKSLTEKMRSIRLRFKQCWNMISFGLPLPTCLPFGGLWLAWNDYDGDIVFAGRYEENDSLFVEHFLKSGMIFLDIGANHGYYTILASKKVSPGGKVIAFEPSKREVNKLFLHVRLNFCKNVEIENVALGNQEGVIDLFLVEGRDAGCNSLRPPLVNDLVKKLQVRVITLDKYLKQKDIKQVDFIKIDAEGAELDVLKGSMELLQQNYKPIILCEITNSRTKPWGYDAKEIVFFLSNLNYYWYRAINGGRLERLSIDNQNFDGNYIAVPKERIKEISSLEQVG
jgi:FkbM family methyltransferase